MPFLKVQTSIPNLSTTQMYGLLRTLSGKLAKHLKKPESYVMTAFESNIPMTFSGTAEPACYLEVKSIGSMSPDQTKAMSQDFCAEIANRLGIDQNRIYIEFTDVKGVMWGWNGDTFG